MHFVCNHKCRVESQTEMADHVVLCRLVLIFFQELGGAGKSNLSNILFHFIRRHSKTVINKFHSLLFWIYDNFDLRSISLRKFIFSHHIQLFQFCDRITSVGDHLPDKNIMIRIYPFFYDRKYILTVNR